MSFEEKFDKIIRQKAEESSFPFDASNWEKASRMIDAERGIGNTAKTGKSATITAVAVSVLVGVLGLLYFTNNSDTRAVATIKTPETTVTASPAAINAADKAVAETKGKNTDPSLVAPVVSATQPELNKITEQPNVTSSDNAATATARNEAPAFVNAPKTQNVNKRPVINPERRSAPESKQADIKTAPKATEGLATEANRQQSSGDDAARKEEGNSAKAANERTPELIAKQSKNEDARVNKAPETFVSPEKSAANESEPALIAKQSEEELLQVENLDLINASNLEARDEEAKLPQLTLFRRYDEDYYKKGIKYKTHFLNLEIGGTYLLGWDAKSNKDAKGFDWFGGFNYAVYITKKIAIGLGVQAYNIKNIDEPFYSTEKTDYGFGSTNTSTVITTKELYYASVPLKVYYKINRYNQVALGLNAGYLYRTNSSMETSYSNEVSPVVSQTHDVYSSLESMNYMLNVSYRLRLGRHFWVNAEGMYGLTDIFHNDDTHTNKQKPSGLRLSLQYTIFDK